MISSRLGLAGCGSVATASCCVVEPQGVCSLAVSVTFCFFVRGPLFSAWAPWLPALRGAGGSQVAWHGVGGRLTWRVLR
eukprot:15149306-Alexandrium_andersonii.AAC.1